MAQVYNTNTANRGGDYARRRTDLPLWVWPLIPLVLGVLALGLSLRDAPARDNAAAPQVTDMLAVVNQKDQSEFVGQTAQFSNVTVQSIVGDRAFWVGPDANQRLMVVQDDVLRDIRPGQQLTLNGTIEEFPGVDMALSDWGIPEGGGESLDSQQVYLHANNVHVDR